MPTGKRALVSVSNKDGLADLGHALAGAGYEIVSTGGSARALAAAGVTVTDVAAITGFPEIMDGRVKTLHPNVHGGILARRGIDEPTMAEHGIEPIDIVVVNLYPFEATIANADATFADAIENIDIGGPGHVARRRQESRGGYPSLQTRTTTSALSQRYRPADRMRHSAANWRPRRIAIPRFTTRSSASISSSNSAQRRPRRRWPSQPAKPRSFATAKIRIRPQRCTATRACRPVRSPPPSCCRANRCRTTTWADADAALDCVRQFDTPACVIVKHANPCGVATGMSALEAYERAYRTDPTSAFGGIIAFNCELDGTTAREIIDRQFVEVLLAPAVSAEARHTLERRSNLRLLEVGR